MSASRHVMILASAGSGKTYALTGRFIRLLAQGSKPERIVALTFTRKAAGEFFDEILKKLAEAAANEERAKILAAETGRPELGRADFLRMLREVTEAMPRLRLGTLDSFFARIARAFALELGLTGDFEILQEYAARLERRRVLQRMFARAGELDVAQKEFIEAFKRATFGRETKRLGTQLDEFIDEHQEIFLAAREGALWGNPELIWPQGCQWLKGKADVPLAVRALRVWLGEAGLGEKQRGRWETFLAELADWAPGVTLPRGLAYVLEKALDLWDDINAGRAVLEFDRKKQELSASACAALRECARHVIGGELARRLETTRGIHAVLRGYENFYHEAVRRAGKMTFGDVQRLLAPGAGAPSLTRGAAHDGRLFIDYRLDAEIDHWLLDEFQDTSYGQWSVLKNLIDEAVQDEAEVRTFFCVGDVKQAIYTWREGDPRLFREILNHYNAAKPDNIAEEHLVESRRSGPALIEMVNTVFGDAAVLQDLFPGDIATNWNREWRAHTTAVPERTGQAAWLHSEEEHARWAMVLELLREIRPLERGLTCAVLVQSNGTAAELAEFLRREGLAAVAEADLHVCTDNPFGQALLALVQAAAHPGDTLAQEHLRMTPLGSVLRDEGLVVPETLAERVLGQIHADGFEHTMEWWSAKLVALLAPDDEFNRTRARQFVAAARLFDETGRRDVAEFVAFMERHTVRENEGAAIIRVMTIHKSKGLGFDVVMLPDLEGKKLDQAREGLAVHKLPDRSVEWVLDLPPKLFCAADEVLAAHVRAAEAEAGYEALSLLYVAMTRAKRAMYVITTPASDSASRNYRRLLTGTLGEDAGEVRVGKLKLTGGWATGEADWHTNLTAAERPAVMKPEIASIKGIEPLPARLMARRPSGDNKERWNAAGLFSLEANAGAEFGSAVHKLFSEVEWNGAAKLAEWERRGLPVEVLNEAAGCLREPGLASIWTKQANAGRKELWRERTFEVVLDNIWVTGVFDRVVVEHDVAGRARRAIVYDFKTDRFAEEQMVEAVSRHMGQLNMYRRVVAVLTGLNLGSVAGELIFTQHRRRVPVPMRLL